MTQEHRYDMSQLEKEEAEDQAADEFEARFDRQKADYLKAYVDENCEVLHEPKFYQEFDSWAVNVTKAEKDKLRDLLRRGHFMLLQFHLGGLFMEYMDEIAARAVRERNNDI